jgi:uncharacterized protein
MAIYQTPGVYVEEISTFPPSVAEVSTAIPAFLGYTEKGGPQVARINTLLEYETLFGKAQPSQFTVTTRQNTPAAPAEIVAIVRQTPTTEFLMYYSLSMYFKNGGGSCYVVSMGNYPSTLNKNDFVQGLTALEREDEPTLILLTDAVNLKAAGDAPYVDYYELCGKALEQCQKLGDRFAILDVVSGQVDTFRQCIGINYLMYGAAYHPYLRTTLTYQYNEDGVTIEEATTPSAATSSGAASPVSTPSPSPAASPTPRTLTSIKATNTALYNQTKTLLNQQRVVMPPSAAIAGIYAQVDRQRGVWKAPANVSVAGVIGPVTKITHEQQESLNVDPTAGKSINAIREFTGKGTLVWGARTLAGNDNEWRYISVRRLFNMIEESAQKSTAFAVFEPNDATTWLKVKAMIEGYLYGLWERGALAGSTPQAAYFVNVGLGKTMTPQDVLEGRMIVELGIAAVRPAEFIILRFTHKMQGA